MTSDRNGTNQPAPYGWAWFSLPLTVVQASTWTAVLY